MQTAKATILFAEDDSSLAFIVKDTLEDEGYKVVHCADGQTAIDSFDKSKFDLCILDIMMPNKDGYSVAKKIRQQTDVMPVLFLSTKNQEEDRLKGYDTGADDYIAKPFSMPELLRKIEGLQLKDDRWALVVGRWALGVGRWALVVGRWSLGAGVQDYYQKPKSRTILFNFDQSLIDYKLIKPSEANDQRPTINDQRSTTNEI